MLGVCLCSVRCARTQYLCSNFFVIFVHGLGCVFKTYWFDAHTAMPREGTTAMTSRKDVTKRWSSSSNSGKICMYLEGSAIGTSTWVILYHDSHLLYIIYNRCCIRIYYLMTWANWLLIFRYRFTRAGRWDKREYSTHVFFIP